jgi:27-O-demethylrifamycin SV methyltransferase
MQSATTTGETPEVDEIAAMLDESSDSHLQLAYRYDGDQVPPIELSQRLTRKVADSLRLREGERVLDVGCGLGASAIQLAIEYGAQVTGVNANTRQLAEANARARAAGLAGQVTFRSGDCSSLDFPDGSFDAVVAMDSLVHVSNLGHTLAGLHRVLRPGGRLSLTEPTRASQFAAGLGAKWLLSVAEWLDPLRDTGFELVEYLQSGPRVFGMGLRYLQTVDTRRDEMVARFGEAAVDELRQTLEYFTPGAGQIGYAVITVRKPRN